jgi:hypothetical protein
MSSLATNAITDAAGGNTTTINGQTPTESNMAGRNRIINGDMRIDQRNAGASVNTDQANSVDRFRQTMQGGGVLTSQQSTNAPTGFNSSLSITVSTTSTPVSTNQYGVEHRIEGYNVADLMYGTANAKTTTLSFWVRSSVTGSFGATVRNSAQDRTYSFLYSIALADTWEYKTVVIPGDTAGTWEKTNGLGFRLAFSLGVATTKQGTADTWQAGNYSGVTGETLLITNAGATFYITGVQLEAGSVATPFEHRQEGRELALCQRYFQKWDGATSRKWAFNGMILGTGDSYGVYFLRTTMRANPVLITSGTASDYCLYAGNALFTCSTVPTINTSSVDTVNLNFKASGMTDGRASMCGSNTNNGSLSFNSEL